MRRKAGASDAQGCFSFHAHKNGFGFVTLGMKKRDYPLSVAMMSIMPLMGDTVEVVITKVAGP